MINPEKLVQQLLNQEYQYGLKILKIVGYEYDRERQRIFIHTDEKVNHFDRPVEDIPELIKQFQPVAKKNEMIQASQADVLIATSANADKLKAILLDNIEKVQKDSAYIKQATAINNNVNTIVNITKMQLDFAKAASKMK